jgi:hypothetical protein
MPDHPRLPFRCLSSLTIIAHPAPLAIPAAPSRQLRLMFVAVTT